MERDTIFLYNEIGDDGKPKGVPQRFKNEIPDLIKKSVKKTDFGAVFSSMCELDDYVPPQNSYVIHTDGEIPF